MPAPFIDLKKLSIWICSWGVCWNSSAVLLGNETPLGRIRPKASEGASAWIGPMRLDSDVRTVFGPLIEARKIAADSLASAALLSTFKTNHLVLTANGDPKPVALAQWEADPDNATRGSLVWSIGASDVPLEKEELILRLRAGSPPESPFTVDDLDGKHLLVKHRGRSVLRYNYGVVRQNKDQPGPYDRACYLHPVWTPSGHIVTGDFSPEHIHQRGVFLAWRSAKFGEVATEFWGLGSSKGRVLPDGTPPRVERGPAFVRLILQNHGVVEDRPVFRERVEVTVFDSKVDGGWLFDFAVHQTPVPGGPVMELPVMFYGGMSFRGPGHWLAKTSGDVKRALERGVAFAGVQWRPENLKLDVLTSEGRDRTSGDRTTARWIDFTGPFEAGWGGVAMFDHPRNPRHPAPLRIHPELPYFSYALMQKEPLTVGHDAPLRLRYRVWVHDGHPSADRNERLAASFGTSAEFVPFEGGH